MFLGKDFTFYWGRIRKPVLVMLVVCCLEAFYPIVALPYYGIKGEIFYLINWGVPLIGALLAAGIVWSALNKREKTVPSLSAALLYVLVTGIVYGLSNSFMTWYELKWVAELTGKVFGNLSLELILVVGSVFFIEYFVLGLLFSVGSFLFYYAPVFLGKKSKTK